jgi:hypothetical protein
MQQDPLIWEALEYEHTERSSDWYWAVGIISVSVAIISIMLGNIIFAIVVMVSAFALIVSARRHPKLVTYQLTSTGIHIDEERFPYGKLRCFWVDDNSATDEISKIYFKSRDITTPLISLPLEDITPQEARGFLLHQLLEEEIHPPLLEQLLKHVGF